jgi:uncharacterized membrane protein YidH (DUF202 family)
VVDKSQSNPISGKSSGINANWRTTFVSKASWCQLRQEDLVRIRDEQVKFISQSGVSEDARIEWYLTWPRKSVHAPNDNQKPTRRTVKSTQSRLELRAMEVGDEIWKSNGVPALDAIVSRISEYQGRRPRALRHLEINATAPGYKMSLGVGKPSRLSSLTTFTCETPGTEIPECFYSVYGILASRATPFGTVMRLGIWMITFLVIVIIPAAAVPAFYVHFQHVRNRDSTTNAACWSAVGYLFVVYIMVLLSLYFTAVRVSLPRSGRFGGARAAFSRAGGYLAWSEPSTAGLFRRHLTVAGSGLAGAGLTALLAYVVATASANARDAPSWPYGLFAALITVGLLFYFIGFTHFTRKSREESVNAEREESASTEEADSSSLRSALI